MCKFHYRGTCTIRREPMIEKCYGRSGTLIAEFVADADPCNREFCPFQRKINNN